MVPDIIEFHEIKAFTHKGRNVIGNPATVAIVYEFPDDRIMGQITKTLANVMTTFIKPKEMPGVYDLGISRRVKMNVMSVAMRQRSVKGTKGSKFFPLRYPLYPSLSLTRYEDAAR